MKALFDAVRALVPARFKSHLFEAVLSDPPATDDYPFVVVGGDTGWDYSGDSPGEDSLGDCVRSREHRFRITVSALSPGAVLGLLSDVREALSRAVPTGPGFVASELRQAPLVDVQTDPAVKVGGSRIYFAVDEYVCQVQEVP